jgi:hypothetical protein
VTPCLGPDEFVDLLEGQLPAARAAHVEACPACREQFAWLQGTLRDALDAPVPEPSPLFWNSLAARVRRDVDGAIGRSRRRWWDLPVLAPAVGLAAAVALLVATIARVPPAVVDPVVRLAADLREAGTLTTADALGELTETDVTEASRAIGEPPAAAVPPIDVVASLVAGLDWDELAAAGLGVQPGAADAAIATLAPDERAALVRALRAALDGPES